MNYNETALKFVEFLNSVGAKKTEALDVSKKTNQTKMLLICSFNNEEKIKETALNTIEFGKSLNLDLLHSDGVNKGQWVVLDFGDFLIEIFLENLREKYNLEKLWKDGKNRLELPTDKKKKRKKEK